MKIYLSPSNQKENKYAYGSTNEAEQCGKIANECLKALERCGFSVKVNQWSSMQTKSNESNSFGADLHVCIHTNAFNGKISGTRCYYYNDRSKGKVAANRIFNRLAPITPGTSENVTAHPTFYEIKTPKAPVAYCECEFHDVPDTAKWIVEHTKEIGEAIAHGVCDYFNIEYVGESVQSTKLYRVQVGAFRSRENANAYLNKIKEVGIDGFIVEA